MAESETVAAGATVNTEGTLLGKTDEPSTDVVVSKMVEGGEGDLEITKASETPTVPSTKLSPSEGVPTENGVKDVLPTELEKETFGKNETADNTEPEPAATAVEPTKVESEQSKADAPPSDKSADNSAQANIIESDKEANNQSEVSKPVPSETVPTKMNVENTELVNTELDADAEAKPSKETDSEVAQTAAKVEVTEATKSDESTKSDGATQGEDVSKTEDSDKHNDSAESKDAAKEKEASEMVSRDEASKDKELSSDKEATKGEETTESIEATKSGEITQDDEATKDDEAIKSEDVKESVEEAEVETEAVETPSKKRGRATKSRAASTPTKPAKPSTPRGKKRGTEKAAAEKAAAEKVEEERVEEAMDTEEAPEKLPKTPILGSLERPVEIQTGKRNRRKVDRLSENISAATPTVSTEKKNVLIPEGSGVRLTDCPAIEEVIQRTKADELKIFHKMLYGVPGKSPVEIKKNIRNFCGWTFAPKDPEYTKKVTAISKLNLPVLKSWCAMLKLAVGGTKEAIVERLMEYLLKPTDGGKQKKPDAPSGKRKRVSGSRKPKSDGKADEKADDESDKEEDESDKSSEEEEEEEKPPSKRRRVADTKKTPARKTKTPARSKASRAPAGRRSRGRKAAGKKAAAEDSEDEDTSPTDAIIKKQIEKILKTADLQLVTMKTVRQQITDMYPDHDLTDRKEFIKATVKQILGA